MKWKSNFFSSNYRIFEDEEKIGYLKEKAFRNTAKAKLKEAGLKFQKKGFFKDETEIRDLETGDKRGQILYNGWGSKAQFMLNGQNYELKYTNIWNTKWTVYDESGEAIINYKSSTFSGNIETDKTDEALILAGLYIHNYYVQISLFMMVIIVIVISGNG